MDGSSDKTATLNSPAPTPLSSEPRADLLYGVGAYALWGLVPLYFHAVAEIQPWTVLCHRILWSAVLLALIISFRGEWKLLGSIVRNGRNLRYLAAGSLLIALNWLIFIYAIASGQTLQASLGYFIVPLLSVALGMMFFGERLRWGQWLAVAAALAAVANLSLRRAQVPWIAMGLALSFGFYGLVRKKVNVNSLHGLLVETAILLPIALVSIARLGVNAIPMGMYGLLSLSGIVTAGPLLLFGVAVRRLKLSTMGFLQYVGPTGQFLVAVLVFHETLDHAKVVSFILCWLAIAVYVADSVANRQAPTVVDEPE